LDYGVTSNLRLFGSWNYGYSRNTGTLGGQDSNIPGQLNTGRTTDPNTFRSDAGSVNPLSVFSFGGDWTPTAKLVVSARYGYFFAGTAVVNTGGSSQSAKAIYFQDAWQVGHGLTLNLGIRLDNEIQPPYDPTRFPSVKFGWGDKIAPRIGGAYDLLHNGKVKVYASYGKFYDIMKMGLARGSFGSDYWHNCVYAMDDSDYTKITTSLAF